jgi:PadR family transcriptional regulator, regulatory protein PadR
MVNLLRDMVQGLVRVHILHAAQVGPVSGVELSDQFAAAGHRLGPGTLYPLLHGMEKAGWLKSKDKTVKGKHRRYYRLTNKGRAALAEARVVLRPFTASLLAEADGLVARAALGVGGRGSGSAMADDVFERGAASDRTNGESDPDQRTPNPDRASAAT